MSVPLWQLMGTQDPQTLIRQALSRMQEEGFIRIEANYEGGNDSGGVTHCEAHRADGTQVELAHAWAADKYDEDSLWAICDNILGTNFGTWAGEFYANGTLFIDPSDERTCWREGIYETPSSEDDTAVF